MTVEPLMDAPHIPSVFDRFETPAASKLLGWTLLSIDPPAGTIEIGFTADERFGNPQGFVQGGIIGAMLDDTHGPALFAHVDGAVFPVTVDYHVSFIKAARFGSFIGKGRLVSMGKTIAFTEAELYDEAGDLVARGTFTSRLVASLPKEV
ncbi:MAG TPA: PaaI family thioesterase [Sphingomicrobium sp.]|nr:PaaI family thioesterase [Sphingomicrobium sp.]